MASIERKSCCTTGVRTKNLLFRCCKCRSPRHYECEGFIKEEVYNTPIICSNCLFECPTCFKRFVSNASRLTHIQKQHEFASGITSIKSKSSESKKISSSEKVLLPVSPTRGPGRPRKERKELTKEPVIIKRGRGRPRKELASAEAEVTNHPMLKRKRGRPPKVANNNNNNNNDEEPKRGRGRPHKKLHL